MPHSVATYVVAALVLPRASVHLSNALCGLEGRPGPGLAPPALRGSKVGRLLLCSSEKKETMEGVTTSMCVISITAKCVRQAQARCAQAHGL